MPPLVLASNAAGEVILPIPIPQASTARFMVQFVLFDQAGCPNSPFSASDAIEVSF